MATTPPKDIQQTVELPQPAPGQMLLGGNLPGQLTLSTPALLEMLSAGPMRWLSAYINALPQWVDDITRDFGADLYERMRLDAQVAACALVIKGSALRDGVQILPVEDQKDEVKAGSGVFGKRPRQASSQSKEIADFVTRNLDNLGGSQSFHSVCDELLEGVFLGNKVAEQVYATKNNQLILDRIKPKPAWSLGFVVDIQNNPVGILPVGPNQMYPQGGEFLQSPKDAISERLLPWDKFVVFSFMPRNGDPRGTSLLRSVYNPWWLKQQTWGEYLKYLTQFAGPSLWANTPEKAQSTTDANGNPVTPEQQLLSQLQFLRNGTIAAVPFGTEIHALQMTGEGKAFLDAFDLFDRQIAKAMTGQTLATEEGKHQARASSQSHADILSLIVLIVQWTLASCIRRCVVKPLVRYNFGDDAADTLTPEVAVGSVESRDFAAYAGAVAALTTAGFLDMSQFEALDQDMGLPQRAAGWQKAAQDAQVALDQTQLAQDTQQQTDRVIARSQAKRTAGRLGSQVEE